MASRTPASDGARPPGFSWSSPTDWNDTSASADGPSTAAEMDPVGAPPGLGAHPLEGFGVLPEGRLEAADRHRQVRSP